jgi:tetratricopeptide (TPR) repeat protein
VSRDESDSRTRVCDNCRAKVSADRQRCPRCGATEATSDPEIDAARSKRLAMISGTLLALALIAVGLIHLQQPAETATVIPKSVTDPLAARRAASAAAVAAAQAEESAPADPAASAEADYAAGDGGKLLDTYRDAVQRRPEDADARTSLAQLLVRLKRTEEALPHFERAIALDAQRPAHHVNLGNAFAQLQRWDEAIESLRRGQQMQPGDSTTTFDLAKALHRKGDHAAAVTEFQKVIGLDPNDPSVRIALAETYEALNQRPQAAEAYTQYLKLAPSGPDADKARLRIARLTSTAEPATPPGL